MDRIRLVLLALLVAALPAWAADADLADYRTAETAIKARLNHAAITESGRSGFLGVAVTAGPNGKVKVAEVATDSPAAKAGVRRGDTVLNVDSVAVENEDAFHDLLKTKPVGATVQLTLQRDSERLNTKATLDPPSRPMGTVRRKAFLGVQVEAVKDGEGVQIIQVYPDTAADRAKLKVGEIILKIDDIAIPGHEKLAEVVTAKMPGDVATLSMIVAEKSVEMKVTLGGERTSEQSSERRPQGFNRESRYWTKPVYRLGIIGVEYPDMKHNEKITPAAWADSMFSKGTYNKTSITGQSVHGSMNDYYIEQSLGKFHIEGKAFDYVEVSKKRSEYATGSKSVLLREALDKLVERDKDALKDLDGVFFIYAGERYQAPRGSLYWPHRSSVGHQGKNWPYFICPEGGPRMMNTSVFCHEFGHMLGLPDLYARPENPGMEGAGVWSAMANQVGNGKPQHFDAWSKEKLGWIKPTTIDPAVKQKLILSPIEDSAKECFKVLARPDGSEYFLLENRRKKGFDQSLPADGLLIWRVIGHNNPVLEESHGIGGAAGPRLFIEKVPFPSSANDAFTPYTTPSSRSQLGGGLPVYITNINRLPDGRISFQIGYEYN